MKTTLSSFGLIVKCTRCCILLCEYCFDRKDEGENAISFENLAKLFDQIGQIKNAKYVHIIWHGGEPLSLGISFFEKALFLQQRLVAPETCIRHSVQTNGTLLNEAWAQFFKNNNFSVGISLDGPQEIHDSQRPMFNGRSSYKGAMDAIDVLRLYGLSFGVLTVATRKLLDYEADNLWKFYQSHQLNSFSILSLRGGHKSPENELAYNRKYGAFMTKLLKLWLQEDNTAIAIREFKSKIGRFFGREGLLCKDGGVCAGKYFGIEPDGSIYHCDKFCSDLVWRLGSLSDSSFSNMLGTSQFCELQKNDALYRNRCKVCEWYHLCGGGCLSEDVALVNSEGQFGTHDCLQYAMYTALGSFLARSPLILETVAKELQV